MKKLLLLTLALVAVHGLMAQDHYSFSQRSSNYTEMTTGTDVTSNDWDYFSLGIDPPFPFEYFGVSVDTIFIQDLGLMFSEINSRVSPHNTDAVSRGSNQSTVTYRVDGTGNTRIMKIQWPNISFFDIVDSFPNDFANYQIWLYEGSNVIEFHYGSSSISAGAVTKLKLFDFYASMISIDGSKWISLGGDPSSASVSYDPFNIDDMNNNPSVNTIFVFTPGYPNGIEEAINENDISIYPIPAGNKLNIESKTAMQRVNVLNMAGQQISTHEVSGTRTVINTDKLAPGIYLVQVTTSEGILTRKISK